jgi:hypothetical protein
MIYELSIWMGHGLARSWSYFTIHNTSMVIESSQQPVKRWRGRPRKTEAVKPVAKKTADTHVARKSTHTDSPSWEEELAAFERRSNKSGILTLLVLLLGIALIGYGMYLKLNQADTSDNLATEEPTVATTGTIVPTTTQTTSMENSNWLILVFFTRINNGQFSALVSLEDTSFKTLPTLRTYFNNARLETFSKNLIWGIRIENIQDNKTDPALWRNPTAKAYDFTMKYTLKSDEKEYSESWRAYTVVKWSGTVINGFVYLGTGFSQSPFFQFSKFGIK